VYFAGNLKLINPDLQNGEVRIVLEESSWQAGQLIALQPQAGQLAQPRQIGDFNARNPVAPQLSAMRNAK
jgi:hypothetical protein